jgi:hypothetical protein
VQGDSDRAFRRAYYATIDIGFCRIAPLDRDADFQSTPCFFDEELRNHSLTEQRCATWVAANLSALLSISALNRRHPIAGWDQAAPTINDEHPHIATRCASRFVRSPEKKATGRCDSQLTSVAPSVTS